MWRRCQIRRWWFACSLAGLSLLAAWGIWYRLAASNDELLKSSLEAMHQGDFARAEGCALKVLARSERSDKALLLAGEAAFKLGRIRDALSYYDRVPNDSAHAALARYVAGDLLLHAGRLADAEARFKAALSLDATHPAALDRLATLLNITGRRFEAVPVLLATVRTGNVSVEHLLWLGHREKLAAYPDELREFVDENDDVLPLLGLARVDLAKGDRAQGLSRLKTVLAGRPDLIEAQIQYGELLLADDLQEFRNWHDRLPKSAETHPGLWLVRATFAEREGDLRAAARCCWEAARHDPDNRPAVYRLGQLLERLGDERSQRFLERAKELEDSNRLMEKIRLQPTSASLISSAARKMESLGRLWEAWGWYRVRLQMKPPSRDDALALVRLERKLARLNGARTAERGNPAGRIDLSGWGATDGVPVGIAKRGETPTGPVALSGSHDVTPPDACRFEERAAEMGIEFTYFNSADPSTEGKRMFEFTGGGIAVLDYDLDGWPDLYFTQGCRWPPEPGQREFQDRLYRNRGGERFRDVTELSQTGDNRFSQGVASGDVNSDGFPDLYVANIGFNRLYVNNGDGTFTDVGADAGLDSSVWTTSCAVVDCDGDGHPDLYDVNYATGGDVFTKICEQDGVPRVCHPTVFPAEGDRLLRNSGSGPFDDMTAEMGIEDTLGRGLGVVAADFLNSGQVTFFVGNDASANFLLCRATPDSPFSETALRTGLAFDGFGKSQACMGLAYGDVDGDSLQDLVVGNFYREHNTLYRQIGGLGMFEDVSDQFGLKGPSLSKLTFGVEFLDADLDGWLDLVMANGHVDDFSHQEHTPYRMRPQFFSNVVGRRFVPLPPQTVGRWFAREQLGRSLARVDCNRDGLEDFAVSHLDTPASVLVNVTAIHGNFLALQLRGVACNRDAIGAKVSCRAGTRVLVKEVIAGDGYQVSNERRLVFGLGDAPAGSEIEIRWPGDERQTVGSLPANSEWIVVQGKPPHRLR